LFKNIFLSSLLLVTTSFAFDTRTHVWVAQEIINDLNDSKLTIEPFGAFEVDAEKVDAILNNQKVFRMGNIGPDGFPDVIAGQVTVHPGLEDGLIDDESTEITHGWKSDEWFKWVIEKAQTPKEKAFAYGFLLHGASDTFAHTYVNMYSGDIFDMNDGETDVEKRHIFLEKFISDRLPAFKDVNGREIGEAWELVAIDDELPISFIKSTLLMNEEVAEQYALSGTASYLKMMYDFREKVASLDDEDTKETIETDLAEADEECDTSWYPGKYLLSIFQDKDEACNTKDYLKAKLAKLENLGLQKYSFKKAWLAKIDNAIDAYIKTSSRMSQQFMLVSGDSYGELTEWIKCYSSAFSDPTTVVSSSVAQTCKLSNELNEKLSFLDDVKAKLDFTALSALKSKVNGVSESLGDEIVDLVSVAALEVILVKEKDVSEADLNEQFSIDDSDKHLLKIDDIASRVKTEMWYDSVKGELNPKEYHVLYNAVVLAKLALLSPSQLNELIYRANLEDTYRYNNEESFSFMFNAIKTIDGNHQWLTEAPPYPRVEGFEDTTTYLYGYENSATFGWKLFSVEELRVGVFNKIFKGPLALGLETPTKINFSKLLSKSYPYVSCERNPFPNGITDKSCLEHDDSNETDTTVDEESEDSKSILDTIIEYLKSLIEEYFKSLVGSENIITIEESDNGVEMTTTIPKDGIEL